MTDVDSIHVSMQGTATQSIQGNTNFYRLIMNNPASVEL
jgi:hypothetical protein